LFSLVFQHKKTANETDNNKNSKPPTKQTIAATEAAQ